MASQAFDNPDGRAAPVSRTEQVDYHLARQSAAQSYNADMSKWILASLILVNGAPFAILGKGMTQYAGLLDKCATWFVIGLALSILCGFCAWLNTGMREAVGGYVVKRLIAGRDVAVRGVDGWEKASNLAVKASYVLSILTGFGALCVFLVGALTLSAAIAKSPLSADATAQAAAQPR